MAVLDAAHLNAVEADELIGQPCHALYAYDRYGEQICGIEAPGGKRFTRVGFGRRMGYRMDDERETKRQRILSDIEWTMRRHAQAVRELEHLDEGYVDWETAP